MLSTNIGDAQINVKNMADGTVCLGSYVFMLPTDMTYSAFAQAEINFNTGSVKMRQYKGVNGSNYIYKCLMYK